MTPPPQYEGHTENTKEVAMISYSQGKAFFYHKPSSKSLRASTARRGGEGARECGKKAPSLSNEVTAALI